MFLLLSHSYWRPTISYIFMRLFFYGPDSEYYFHNGFCFCVNKTNVNIREKQKNGCQENLIKFRVSTILAFDWITLCNPDFRQQARKKFCGSEILLIQKDGLINTIRGPGNANATNPFCFSRTCLTWLCDFLHSIDNEFNHAFFYKRWECSYQSTDKNKASKITILRQIKQYETSREDYQECY